ncbi:MAG: CPBP family intramembrane glutamic endopeptidase [Rikenellaceae bacterium]
MIESKNNKESQEQLIGPQQYIEVADADTMEATYNPPPSSASRSMMFPSWGDLLAILGIFLAAQIITSFIYFIVLGFENITAAQMSLMDEMQRRAAEFSMGEKTFVWAIISQPLTLIMVVLYRYYRGGKAWVVKYSINGFNPTVLLWGVLMLLSIVFVVEPLKQLLPETQLPTGRGRFMLLSLVCVAPLFEELLCRGIIMEAIRGKRGAWAACVISSLIFGVIHIEPQSMLNAFVIGLMLGYLYLRTNSIFAPIIMHSINNVLAYLILLFGLGNSTFWELIGNETAYFIAYAVASAMLLLSTISIARYITKLERHDKLK